MSISPANCIDSNGCMKAQKGARTVLSPHELYTDTQRSMIGHMSK